MSSLEILLTADGSHTLRNTILNETYHSVHGAVQESMHVFIRSGLEYLFEERHSQRVSILEIGFGTGLNALLAWQFAKQKDLQIRYTALEPFPLGSEMWEKLNYAAGEWRDRFKALHEAGAGSEVFLSPEFAIIKLQTALQEIHFRDVYDIIFFDAFAPSIQPELWTYECLHKVTGQLTPSGVFVTYSAKGQLKRDLRALGFRVETLAGPPGKKEMVRAVSLSGERANPRV